MSCADRFRMFLMRKGLWDDRKQEELQNEAKQNMLHELKQVEQRKCCPILPGLFDDVYDEKPWHIQV